MRVHCTCAAAAARAIVSRQLRRFVGVMASTKQCCCVMRTVCCAMQAAAVTQSRAFLQLTRSRSPRSIPFEYDYLRVHAKRRGRWSAVDRYPILISCHRCRKERWTLQKMALHLPQPFSRPWTAAKFFFQEICGKEGEKAYLRLRERGLHHVTDCGCCERLLFCSL